MSSFVESLKRLYAYHVVTYNKIMDLYRREKITLEEKRYILSEQRV